MRCEDGCGSRQLSNGVLRSSRFREGLSRSAARCPSSKTLVQMALWIWAGLMFILRMHNFGYLLASAGGNGKVRDSDDDQMHPKNKHFPHAR